MIPLEKLTLIPIPNFNLHNFLNFQASLFLYVRDSLFRLSLSLSVSSLVISLKKNRLKSSSSSHSVFLCCDSHAEVLSGSCLFIHPFLHFVSPLPQTWVPLRPHHIPRVTQQVSRPINQSQASPLCAANVINRC